ncbi:MAG: septal ring lytic transglycosylase RlpA family protein [Proteobacteria bacterium]|nr:septal ring lytic transglycosylase RlpA family protein [Pseudomonadota bacterium]MBU1059394.1 septal ring lytic transglycosylase RlpA family protein [Pseudomonadota bacterium]
MKRFSPKNRNERLSFYPFFLFFLVFFPFCLLPVSGLASTTQKQEYRIPGTQRPYVINDRTYCPLPSSQGYEETGVASWYGSDFHGRATSNGETYDMYDMTAAHKLLPMHTMLLVTNLDNGRKTIVRVNDRGPFVQGRIIDLSLSAARKLALWEKGTARVKVTALGEIERRGNRQMFAQHADFNKGEFYVQIGAFTMESNGLQLQKRFLDAGHKAVIRKGTVNGETFYRVHVYVGSSLDSARRSETALLAKGYDGSFIIAR